MINSPGQARHERRPGKMSPNPAFPFSCFAARRGKTGKREVFTIGLVTPGGATLARGYYRIVPTGLRLGSLRSLMAELLITRNQFLLSGYWRTNWELIPSFGSQNRQGCMMREPDNS